MMKNNVLCGIIFIALLGCSSPPSEETLPSSDCTSKECFINLANECKEATVLLTEEAGQFSYASKDCVLSKTLVGLDTSETSEMKALLEGKSMTCPYGRGKFDSRWVNSLIYGLEYCNGPLKDALSELIVYS